MAELAPSGAGVGDCYVVCGGELFESFDVGPWVFLEHGVGYVHPVGPDEVGRDEDEFAAGAADFFEYAGVVCGDSGFVEVCVVDELECDDVGFGIEYVADEIVGAAGGGFEVCFARGAAPCGAEHADGRLGEPFVEARKELVLIPVFGPGDAAAVGDAVAECDDGDGLAGA